VTALVGFYKPNLVMMK